MPYAVLQSVSTLRLRDCNVLCVVLAAGAEGVSRPSTTRAPKPAPSQLFDILPIHGILEPGQTEQVEFSFYAFPGVKATAQAACSVVDGPVYQVCHSVLHSYVCMYVLMY